MNKLTHIELFADCGGLNFGLETTNFNLYFANELSPMAGETFAFNFLKEDLSQLAIEKKASEKVLWINSNFSNGKVKDRNIDILSEGPPCQSFSLAGKREQNNEKNLLPLSFATFTSCPVRKCKRYNNPFF